jgi:hypothetical protein
MNQDKLDVYLLGTKKKEVEKVRKLQNDDKVLPANVSYKILQISEFNAG